MADLEAVAFMSYVRSDDDHDGGNITRIRERLEGEMKIQTGRPFSIFQDRNDIQWGQQWAGRIHKALSSVTFLIPIITPSFFNSPACQEEFQQFLLREKTIGERRLILPIYYVSCAQLEPSFSKGKSKSADVLRERQWTDWRPFRFRNLSDADVAAAIAKLAQEIKTSMEELESIMDFARAQSPDLMHVEPKVSPPLKAEPSAFRDASPTASEPEGVPQARPKGEFNLKKFREVIAANAYYAYTKEFDEVVSARDLASDEEIVKNVIGLRHFSDEIFATHKGLINEVSEIVSGLGRLPSMSVTLLLDNSGSMRGHPITYVAATALLVAEWLDRWGIRVEVLGYTTVAWKGGRSRQQWLADSKPANPGRLNDLRHIIYKSFEENFSFASSNFGVMLKDGVIKENIDGEALIWANSRLQKERSEKKLLVVITDGAPVDDSTLSVNPGDFLTSHLVRTVHELETFGLDLQAVGVVHDPKFYTKAAQADYAQLGIPFFRSLKVILQNPGS